MLEPAAESDISAIVDLVNTAYRGTGPTQSWNFEDFIDGPRIDAAAVQDDMTDPDIHMLVHRGTGGGPPLATVRLEPEGEGAWHLGLLSVSPARQKDGLGRSMMAAAEDFARARGARTMRLSVVHLRDTLIGWYERRGYRRNGQTAPFPYADNRFGTPLRDDLHFVLLEKAL